VGDAVRDAQIVSILLLEDLAIVPLLAIVTFLAPIPEEMAAGSRLVEIAIAIAALAGVYLAGRFLLNPLFRIPAPAHARARAPEFTYDARPEK